jgi:hypothetical protein
MQKREVQGFKVQGSRFKVQGSRFSVLEPGTENPGTLNFRTLELWNSGTLELWNFRILELAIKPLSG